MASALLDMAMDFEDSLTPSVAPFCNDNYDFEGDSDESSICSSKSLESFSFCPADNPGPLPETSFMQNLPEVVINSFDLNQILNQNLPLRFFMTNCTPEVLGPLLFGPFLETLYKTESWKLYVTELIYGYLNFVTNCRRQNPLDNIGTSSIVPNNYSNGIIESLRHTEKIRVLRKHVPELVELSQKAVGHPIVIKATVLTPGLLSQVIQFDILTSELTCMTSTHVGTIIPHDLILQGCYPTPPHEQGGFPLQGSRDSGDNCSQNSATRTVFARRLKKLAQGFRNPKNHYQLRICDSDKLVDLWYLKNLSDQFSTKIHVSQEYYEFVAQHISQFADCFTPQNKNGEAKIHYECCSTSCDKVGGYFDRCPSNLCHLQFGSRMSTISINGTAESASDINLPFIHEM